MGLTVGLGSPHGGDGQAAHYSAYAAEVGVSVPGAPAPMRARAFGLLDVHGAMRGPDDYGVWRLGAGVELRTCSPTGRSCWFAGLDLGYQSHTYATGDAAKATARGLLFGPRLGIDLGSVPRVRLALELYAHDQVFVYRFGNSQSDGRMVSLAALALSIGAQL